ncbi:MAG TPA: nucleotidyltransferase family protein [Stellaceae bacterium]
MPVSHTLPLAGRGENGYNETMNRNRAIAALRQQAEAVKAFGATSLYLFGSTARNQATPASDLDLFIEYDPHSHFSLVELVGIKQHLENRLRVTVDLTTRDSLDPLLRSRIEASAEQIF